MTQPSMNDIMAQAQQMQKQLQEAQAEISAVSIVGESGNGKVTIVLSGSGEVQNINLDPEVVDPKDVETLQDLIVVAFTDANRKLQDLAQEKMGPLADMGGLGF